MNKKSSNVNLLITLISMIFVGNAQLVNAQTNDNFRFNPKDFTNPLLQPLDLDKIITDQGLNPDLIITVAQAQKILIAIEEQAEEKPALVYVSFTPPGYQPQNLEKDFAHREVTNTQQYNKIGINKDNLPTAVSIEPRDDYILDLLIITGKDNPFRITVPVTHKQVVENANNLWMGVSDVFNLDDSYKPYATKLYSWLIEPLEAQLQKRKISNLLFILPTEIRFTPMAALYDGKEQKFLIVYYSEKYSIVNLGK